MLTVSDRSARGEREDTAGPALVAELEGLGFDVTLAPVVADEREAIAARLRDLAADHALVVTTGGTGFGARDVTPEATADVMERPAPGLVEEIRRRSAAHFPHAVLSRATAGIRGGCLILNLPGSPKGALESLRYVAGVLPHALDVLTRAAGERDDEHPAGGGGG